MDALETIENGYSELTLVICCVTNDYHSDVWDFFNFDDVAKLRHELINFQFKYNNILSMSLYVTTNNSTIANSTVIVRNETTSSKEIKLFFDHLIKWIDERPELLV